MPEKKTTTQQLLERNAEPCSDDLCLCRTIGPAEGGGKSRG